MIFGRCCNASRTVRERDAHAFTEAGWHAVFGGDHDALEVAVALQASTSGAKPQGANSSTVSTRSTSNHSLLRSLPSESMVGVTQTVSQPVRCFACPVIVPSNLVTRSRTLDPSVGCFAFRVPPRD